jgi:hypothetical protein
MRFLFQLQTLLVAMAAMMAGCGEWTSADVESPAREMLFVDTRSGEAVAAPATAHLPAVNPATGKRTLMPGLYCPECRKWRATPPIEEINRQPGAGMCPVHKTPLTPHGPWPGEGALRAQTGDER